MQLSISIDADGRFKLMLESPSNDKLAYLRVVKTVNETEGFRGLGEVFDDVNHRGKVRSMQLRADFLIESANNEGMCLFPCSWASGWGVFYHSFYPSVFGVANESDDRVDFAVGLGLNSAKG